MQATDVRGRTFRDTAVSDLAPETLYDLLANFRDRRTWDLCPAWLVYETYDVAPGIAVEGTTIVTRGTARGIPFTGSSVVTRAERPTRLAYRSATKAERAMPDGETFEEYTLEPQGAGSLVHYSMTLATEPGTGSWINRVLNGVLGPILSGNMTRRNFRNGLRWAEAYARSRR